MFPMYRRRIESPSTANTTAANRVLVSSVVAAVVRVPSPATPTKQRVRSDYRSDADGKAALVPSIPHRYFSSVHTIHIVYVSI